VGKILTWLLLALAGYLVYKFLVISKRKADRVRQAPPGGAGPTQQGGGDAGGPGGAAAGGEPMLRCARCGVHVPASEAIDAGDRHYCSAEHRDADRRP
jgi:uncharacterized protein